MFKQAYSTIESAAAERNLNEVCDTLVEVLERSGTAETAPSIGIPIVMPDGKHIAGTLESTFLNWLDIKNGIHERSKEVEKWIRKGWIDLRPNNIAIWQARFQKCFSLVHNCETWALPVQVFIPLLEILLRLAKLLLGFLTMRWMAIA